MTKDCPPHSTPADTERRCGERGFWSLFVTQFQGAFSDNLYRTLAMFLLIGMTLPHFKGDSRELRMALVGALFALPFLLFSMAGGYLADRFSKRSVAISVKVAEIGIMALALVALAGHAPFILLTTVFLMGTHSAFFGPTKYGLLPELLPEKRLSWGNGVIELGTFLAIIAGTMAGGWLFEVFQGTHVWTGVVLIGLAVFGFITSLGITRVPAADPAKKWKPNFLRDLFGQIRVINRDRVLSLAVMGNTYFFFLGALIQQYTIYAYGKDLLGLSERQITTYLMSAMAVGIGVGSYAAGHLSGRKIEYGLVPLGSLGMTVFGTFLAWPGRSLTETIVGLASYGFFCGFFIVPVSALIQHRPERTGKGGIIAAANFLSFVGIFLAAGIFYLLAGALELNPRQVFLATTLMTFGGTLYALWLLPDAFLRFILWLVTHTIYRVRVEGRDNIPEKGGALFVCNHVSFVDALLLIAATDRHVRFMMFKGTYELPYVKPFARTLGIIPISSEQRPRDMIKSLQAASEAIRSGHIVCIFAEGQITRTGQLLPFRRGLERIMKDVEAPIVPISLDGVWGSIFSFESKRFIWKLPHHFPYPVTVSFGPPLPANTSALEVRQAVQELQAAGWYHRRERMRPLHRAFVRVARRLPLRFAMADPMTPHISFGGALMRTVLLGRRLRQIWTGQKMVGLLLPPSVAGALTNWAALLCGKVPVNLNYTLSEESLGSCVRQCNIKTILTSRAFVEKVKLRLPGNVLFLEDLLGKGTGPTNGPEIENADRQPNQNGSPPSTWEKLLAFFMAWLLPVSLLERCLRTDSSGDDDRGLDSLATVIFSSGSTGEPKGVMLSHYNVASNIEQLGQVFAFSGKDRMAGVLPFFHSFGFTGTLALPGVFGIGVIFHANPLDAKTVGQLVCDYEATFLLATPTFLQLYMRGCAPEQFGSLRLVAVGAEKLPLRLASAFEERFGVGPFEAYGCTECAPAVAVNTYDFRAAGFRQVGGKQGKIGHPLPGIGVRIVDPVSFAPLPVGQAGLLLVRGPNIMMGYLGRADKTAEVMRDGFYVTGDVAAQDEDGFLEITDRLSRFSKIGGEMVPHIKVEERLHELAEATEQTFVVTGVPDEKKGERLVVLHKLTPERLRPCLEKLAQCDLPNLWKPRAEAFCRVENFPVLGTGKLDLRKIKELAVSASRDDSPPHSPAGEEVGQKA